MLKSRFIIIASFIISLAGISNGLAQTGNEWINFNQAYYKLIVNQEGVYQISYNDLIAANIALSTIDARSFQLFHRGQEVSIHIDGQSDGRIDQGDYIEFIGKANDGQSDTPLYDDPSSQPHTYYNLFTDETAYFLTWKLDGTFGKRMQRISPINNSGGLPVESSVIKQIRNVFVSDGIRGQPEQPANEVFKSAFNLGECWTGPFFSGQSIITVNNINQQERSTENLNFEILIQGRNNLVHDIEVKIGPNVNTLRTIENVTIEDFQYAKISQPILWSDINVNGSLTVVINCPVSRASVSYMAVDYNRTLNVSNEPNASYEILPNPQGNSFVSFTNTNSSAKLYELNSFNNPVILETNRVGATISTVIAGTASGKKIYLKNQAFLTAALNKVVFRDYSTVDPEYVIISNKVLNQSADEYAAVITDYASYRASSVGGNYDTLVAYIDQLFNQFNYGEASPMAIYRFSKYLLENTKTAYVFIIGKGINWYQRPYRSAFNDSVEFTELVPSAGSPGSDNLFAYEQVRPNELALSFGRLNAHNPQVVADYLNKIKEMELQPLNDLRRKAFLHLSGGISEIEISRFNGYIEDFSSYAVSPYIGGSAENVTKETTQVVELINVSEQVNEGVNMITFFGHSGANTADINIGFVSDPTFGYRNAGKYPLIYVNGCDAGAIYERPQGAITFGENWVNTPDLGATHVLAHTSEGFPNELKRYSDIFYLNAFGDSTLIDKPIGKIHIATSNKYLSLFGNNPLPLFVSQALQFNLMGDPAYKLFPANRPDFEVNDVSIDLVSLDGQDVDALTTNFAFDILLKNYGITIEDSLAITANRILSSGEIIPLDTQYFSSPYNIETVRYFVENNRLGEFGESRFEVVIDPNNQIEELDESNNIGYFNYFFSIGSTINLYPYNSSIVNTKDVSLVTQSVDLLSDSRDFLFELDTTNTFSSPFLKSARINGKVLARQSFSLLDVAGKNYYWRTKFADLEEGELDEWTISQFVYDGGAPKGWVQNNYEEYKKNDYNGIIISPSSWQYLTKDIAIKVINPADSGAQKLVVSISNEDYTGFTLPRGGCKVNSVNLVAFDQTNGIPYRILRNGAPDINDPLSCGKRPQVINQILNANLNDPTTYFKKYYDQLPAGDFVLISSYDSVAWPILVANSRAELLDLGASMATIDNLKNGNPYILLGKKGLGEGNGIESFSFATSPPANEEQLIVSLEDEINIRFSTGFVASNTIGPVKSWQEVDATFTDLETQDDIQIDIFGIDTLNNQTLLFSDAVLPQDISDVDASKFPFIRLRAKLTDSIGFTPPRLLNWQITYEELPDLVLLLDQQKPKSLIQLAEGDSLEVAYEIVNVTPNDFQDSVLFVNRIYNQENRVFKTVQSNLPPILGEESYQFKKSISSRKQVGVNDFFIAVNTEKTYNEFRKVNNQIGLRELLEVKRDSIPPFIEVTFDGINILDGDIVSPSPYIQIAVKDENSFLPLSDTTGLSLSIEGQCETCVSKQLYFSDPKISYQRSAEANSFIISYRPDRFEDGTYTLSVNAKDGSNNEAGSEPYRVSFEVVNASTITKFFPYPNPFSTQTRFVFTLTGAQIPDEIKIQIMTVTGRVVREILQDEIGLIHIGNNITDYAWDGRDEFGDKLANGVYIYRVLVRKNGVYVDQRETSADKAFKKGYGKMYILR